MITHASCVDWPLFLFREKINQSFLSSGFCFFGASVTSKFIFSSVVDNVKRIYFNIFLDWFHFVVDVENVALITKVPFWFVLFIPLHDYVSLDMFTAFLLWVMRCTQHGLFISGCCCCCCCCCCVVLFVVLFIHVNWWWFSVLFHWRGDVAKAPKTQGVVAQ